MVEDSLLVLIQIITDLPLPSVEATSSSIRVTSLLRRELIHKLASGPKTYSQLQECLTLVTEFDKCETSLFDSVLEDISYTRDSSSLEAPLHSLKAELWLEYDPSFMHVSSSSHQEAYEKRPKLSEPRPLTISFSPCHSLFSSLRLSILCDDLLQKLIRSLIFSAASRRCPDNRKYSMSQDQCITCSESEYFRVLHIVTLMVHVLIYLNGVPEEENQELRGSFINLSDFFTKSEKSELHGMNDVFFGFFIDIYKSYNSSEEVNHKMWHKWVIDKCSEILPSCRKLSTDQLTLGEVDKKSLLEAKKKLAREKAMKSIQDSARSFTSHIEAESVDPVIESGANETPICIICQEESNSMLGYLGLSQVY